MIYFLYKITNLVNKKLYIGKSNNLRLRFNSHRTMPFSADTKIANAITKLYPAIRKYGISNFTFETIAYCENENDCYVAETTLIERLNTIKNGYNTSLGGFGQSTGFKHTQVSIDQIKEATTGTKNHFYGKKHTKESLQKMADSHKKTAPRGENNKSAILTENKVREMRDLYLNKNMKPKEISKIFNVALGTVKDIVYFKTWKHIK